jgi:hypothetical protein
MAHTRPDEDPAADCSLSKIGHYSFQIRPLGVETGQYRLTGCIQALFSAH